MENPRPKMPRLALAALTALGFFFLALTLQKIWSADVWWQLRNGEWIAEHRDVPRQEMYSHTMHGNPLREMRWVWCVLLYWGWTHAGAWLLVLGQVAVLAGTWLALAWPNRRALLGPLGVLVVGLGLAAGFGRWVMRPEIVTFLMIAAFLAILHRHTTSGRSRAAWLLIPLQVVWTNTHTLFLFGPLLAVGFIGAALAGRALAKTPMAGRVTITPAVPVTGWLFVPLLVIPAIWVNPYGTYGAAYVLQMWNESRGGHVTAQILGEMKSPLAMPLAMWTWDFYAAAALAVVGVGTFMPARPRLDLRTLGVFGVGLYLACTAQRNIALFAVMGSWAALVNLSAARATGCRSGQPLRPQDTACPKRHAVARMAGHAALAVALLAGAWYVATDRYSVRMNLTRAFGLGVVEWNQPRATAAYLRVAKPAGNLFNIMRDGSYFVWAMKGEYPVFVDGRTDAYGPEFLGELSRVNAGSWDALADKYAINIAVIPNRDYQDVIDYLRASSAWALVHVDESGLVFVRRAPANEAVIAAAARPSDADERMSVDPKPRGWLSRLGRVSRPHEAEGYALSYLAAGNPARARLYLEPAVNQYSAAPRLRVLLAPLLEADGEQARAMELVNGLSRPERAAAAREAARLLTGAGKFTEALPPLERAMRLAPADLDLQLAYADLSFRTGDLDRAVAVYLSYLDEHPSANEWAKVAYAYDQLGRLDYATDAYRRSLELDPAQPAIWNMLGAVHGRAGHLEEAKRCFERALHLKPDFDAARRNLQKIP